MIPERIGHYRVDRLLGEGMSGIVYAGMDETLGRKVAIKVLREELTYDEVQRERFVNEAKIMAHVNHPNIVQVYQLIPEGRRLSIVMELLPDTLEAKLERLKHLPLAEALQLTQQAISALSAVHALEVTHRDIKPANMMLAADGSVRVSDFSISRIAGAKRATATGVAIGTAFYMAPEQLRAHPGDARTDIYALACVLTEMLTGTPPFVGETPTDITHGHLRLPPPRIRTRDASIPRHVEAAIERAMAKEPADRFQSMDAFGEALRSEGETGRSNDLFRLWPVAAAAALLVAVGGAVAADYFAKHSGPQFVRREPVPSGSVKPGADQKPIVGMRDANLSGGIDAVAPASANSNLIVSPDPVPGAAQNRSQTASLEPQATNPQALLPSPPPPVVLPVTPPTVMPMVPAPVPQPSPTVVTPPPQAVPYRPVTPPTVMPMVPAPVPRPSPSVVTPPPQAVPYRPPSSYATPAPTPPPQAAQPPSLGQIARGLGNVLGGLVPGQAVQQPVARPPVQTQSRTLTPDEIRRRSHGLLN